MAQTLHKNSKAGSDRAQVQVRIRLNEQLHGQLAAEAAKIGITIGSLMLVAAAKYVEAARQ